MRGKLGLLTGLTSLFLMFGAYGCDEKEQEPEARPAYHVVETGENEYRVEAPKDPPPKISIVFEPFWDSVGTEARVRVMVNDPKQGNSGITDIKVYDDCDLIGDYKPEGKIRTFFDKIPVEHHEEGDRSFYVMATDLAGQTSEANKNLYFSGEVIDLPPRIQRFVLDEGGFEFDIYDPGERSGFMKVTLREDGLPLQVWDKPTFSGSGAPMPDGRTGTHVYTLEAEDIGGHITTSDITVNYGRGAP